MKSDFHNSTDPCNWFECYFSPCRWLTKAERRAVSRVRLARLCGRGQVLSHNPYSHVRACYAGEHRLSNVTGLSACSFNFFTPRLHYLSKSKFITHTWPLQVKRTFVDSPHSSNILLIVVWPGKVRWVVDDARKCSHIYLYDCAVSQPCR